MSPEPQKPFSYLKYLGLGVQLAVYILAMTGLGMALDYWLDTTKPWFTVVLALAGTIMGILHLLRVTRNGKL